MPSPFPGMNPFLEQEDAWHDFHERFIPFAAGLIGEQIGEEYIVKIDENIYVHELPEQRQLLGRGDFFVADQLASDASSTATIELAAPATVELSAVDVEREGVIHILDRRSRTVVTVVELLSPSNKNQGGNRDQYLSKRGKILESPTHLVEIDLLRGGPRMPMRDLPPCDYCVLVSTAPRRPMAGIWPVGLREPLPCVPIPLHAGDAPPRLDLQEALHCVYEAAGYRKYIYGEQPRPPLSPADQTWADAIVREHVASTTAK